MGFATKEVDYWIGFCVMKDAEGVAWLGSTCGVPAAAALHHQPLLPSRLPQSDWLSSYWAGFMSPSQHSRIRNTGVPMDLLRVRTLLSNSGACCVVCMVSWQV